MSAVAETRQPVAATTPGTSFPVSAQRTKLSRVEISDAARTPAVAPAAVRRAAADRVETPRERKPLVDLARLRVEDPPGVRRLLGDGSYGGVYSRSEDDWRRVWKTGVEEVREVLEHGWR